MAEYIHLPETFCTFDGLKFALNKQGYDIVKSKSMNKLQTGGVAKGMSLSDIANKHGLSIQYMRPEFELGTKHEFEHINDKSVAERIALDHLLENPRYYTMLEQMESDAKKNRKKIELPTELKAGATNNKMSFGGKAQNALHPTKYEVFSYWENEERKNKNEYTNIGSSERDETQMGEDAARNFGVDSDMGNTEIENLIFEWAVDYCASKS